MFVVTNDPKPNAQEGSILIHPLDFKNYMMMLVYKNGATTRKHIRDSVNQNDDDWSRFNKCMSETPVGNNGCLSFYFVEHEITPNVHGKGIVKFNRNDEVVCYDEINKADCRGIIESQVNYFFVEFILFFISYLRIFKNIFRILKVFIIQKFFFSLSSRKFFKIEGP